MKLPTEEEQDEESAASAGGEELGALVPAPPPAVQEVPLRLQKQHVRKWDDGCLLMI